jgi:exopolysaccharide biosynthesis polyprenyl glycosylphosphotransferase
MGAQALARAWERRFARLLVLSDSIAIVVAVFASQFTRFGLTAPSLPTPIGFDVMYTVISAVLGGAWLTALSVYGTRDPKVFGTGSSEFRRVGDATIRVFGLVAIAMFLLQSPLGRGYFLLALPLGVALLFLGRWVCRRWLLARRRQSRFVHRALLVGRLSNADHVLEQILAHGKSGLLPVGMVTEEGSTRTEVRGIPVLGHFSTVLAALDASAADTLVFTGADEITPQGMRELGWALDARRVSLVVAPALTDVAGPRIHARPVAGLPLIHVEYPSFEGRLKWTKRFFDVVSSALGLVLLSPLLLALAIAVRRGSPGPALFAQERVGLGGETFRMLKFRTMVVEAEDLLPGLLDASDGNGRLFKLKRDPRVTRVGALLRRYSLDELPQLVNVLRGDMSLVGPRPPLRSEVEQYNPWEHRRFLVPPGVTGLWQVSGRSDLSWEDSIRLDLYYVENWSLTGDLAIVYRTARTVVSARGAY